MCRLLAITTIILFTAGLPAAPLTEAPAELEVNDIKIALVNDDGRTIKTFAMPSNPSDRSLFFSLCSTVASLCTII